MRLPQVINGLISKKLRRELLRFLLVGGIAVFIDGFAYWILVRNQILSPSWAKRLSFLLGAIWAFFMNKFYTFEQKQIRVSEPFAFAMVYLAGWLLNSISHDVALNFTGIRLLAFTFATGVSTCSNFAGQKWIVFRTRSDIIACQE